MENSITTISPSQNIALSNALMALEGQFLSAAQHNLDQAISLSGEDYNDIEKRAMLVIEELKLVNSMDLAAVMMRGKLIRQIREEALWTAHPNQYHTLDEMARDQGIGISELSNTIDLVDTIFPYMESVMGVDVPTMWEQIGKSNFRELIPTLKGIITGTPARSALVNNSVEGIINDVVATARATGDSRTGEEFDNQMREAAVGRLLEQGGQMTNTVLRGALRGQGTPAIDTHVVRKGSSRYIVAKMDEDQFTMFTRVMGRHINQNNHEIVNPLSNGNQIRNMLPELSEIVEY